MDSRDTTSTGSSYGNTRLYTGRYYDREVGLSYHRARYYDPQTGRFTGRDPIGQRDQVNLFTYVGNSPMVYVDRDGRIIKKFIRDVVEVAFGIPEANAPIENYTSEPEKEYSNAVITTGFIVGLLGFSKAGALTDLEKELMEKYSKYNLKSTDELVEQLKKDGYDVSMPQPSKFKDSNAEIINIKNPSKDRNITQVQFSPGGGTHGPNSYVKISTSDNGKIKFVQGKAIDYVTKGKENATVFFTP